MACGTTISKYLVFIFNFLFFLAGVLLIVIGALTVSHKQKYLDVVPNAPDFSSVAILFIIVGSIVTVIAFFGCCGAVQENVCMLNTFAILLIIIILAEVAIAIAALVLRNRVGDEFKKSMSKSLVDYNPNAVSNTSAGWLSKTGWDAMQQEWKCCGVNNYTDWRNNTNFPPPTPFTSRRIPNTCCASNSTCNENSGDKFTKGCFEDMTTTINALYLAIGVIGIVVGMIEIIGIVMACCLSQAVKHT